jgi:type VI secretion system protein VasI
MRALWVGLGVLLAVMTAITPVSVAECTCEDLQQKIALCAAIVGELERLECYDQLARSLGLVAVTTVQLQDVGTGKWRVSTTIDPLDDSTTVVLILYADSGKSIWGDPIALVLRCDSKVTEAYINWHTYLGDEAHVTWRIGDASATTAKWSLSTDWEATFYPYDTIAFIRQLLAADRFVAQVTPYGESPITAVFDLTGLANAIPPLQEACGWR